MPSATLTAAAAAASQNRHCTLPISFKPEPKPFYLHTNKLDPSSSSSCGPIRIDGCEFDNRTLNRRARRVKQLARICRDHCWASMDELKLKYREYYWDYGKSPFVEAEYNEIINSNCGDCLIVENVNNGNLGGNGGNNNSNVANRCGVHGCKAMALTRFCHMHILSDAKQKLYKACSFSIKRSSVPSYCPLHFQKAEKHMARALKKAGLNVSSTSKLSPKFHVIVAEYVHQIQIKRRAAQKANLEIAEVKEDNNS
ncbi:hypothetical protein Pfo_015776 [Paulownia fortunei]|nr:hypothetical protein Pfo_015776 [Paulownia fortunei]